MYGIDLTTGIILVIFGICVTVYLMYLTKTGKDKYKPSLYFSEALATTTIGVFYIVCAIILWQNESNDLVIQTEDMNEGISAAESIIYEKVDNETFLQQVFNTNNFVEISDPEIILEDKKKMEKQEAVENFLQQYKKFIMSNIKLNPNKTNESEKRHYARSLKLSNSNCNHKSIHLKYALLVTSFLYAVISVVNSALDCKSCLEHEKKIAVSKTPHTAPTPSPNTIFIKSKSDSEVFGPKVIREMGETSSQISVGDTDIKPLPTTGFFNKKLICQITTSWLIPILYAIIVYFGMIENKNLQFNNKNELSPEIVNILELPLNITNAGNETKEVNDIITKIYTIVDTSSGIKQAPTKQEDPPIMYDIVKKLNQRKGKNINQNKCDYMTMYLKIHTLILFIVSYFAALFYTKSEQTKIINKAESDKVKQKAVKLSKSVISFGLLWMPCTLEIFTRTYLMRYEPNILSDICLAFGNLSRIVTNVINVSITKDVLRKYKNISPAEV